MGLVRYMAEPRIGVYFLIGVACGFIISFMSSSYSKFVYVNPVGSKQQNILSGTATMIFASNYSSQDSVPQDNELVLNTDKPPTHDSEAAAAQQCNCSATCPPGGPPILSHEQVDLVNKLTENEKRHNFDKEDQHMHNDDHTVAQEFYNKVKVLVWVMTQPDNLEKKARHVNATWGKRANKILYASDYYDKDFPTMPITIPHGREHLTAKTMAAFDYVYEKYIDDYDWFMKADDDTYVIMENLRYFLSSYDPREPVYFGHLFQVIVKQGYYSGGGGYVLSKEALRRFGERSKDTCAADQGAEDVQMGKCMERLGVKTQETLDALGHSRFHCFNPGTHLGGHYPDWFMQYDKYDGKLKGGDSISDYAISFHYVPVQEMYLLEFVVYHLRPYGIQFGLQDLNRHRLKETNSILSDQEEKEQNMVLNASKNILENQNKLKAG